MILPDGSDSKTSPPDHSCSGRFCATCYERPQSEPCSEHPGRENHCLTGACGACWLCKEELRSMLLVHLSGRHVKLYGGAEGLLHHDSVDQIIDGLLREIV